MRRYNDAMSTKIESTVRELPDAIAKSGASGDQRVFVTILDSEEAVKLEELRQLIDEGLASGEAVDGEEAMAQVRRNLIAQYPELADATSDI